MKPEKANVFEGIQKQKKAVNALPVDRYKLTQIILFRFRTSTFTASVYVV
jgi:hypothetical protein